jgi:hypothetical protein
MKIEKLSAMAELVSSVAIVATLIYLAVQTQQTNAALFANSRQGLLMADMSGISNLVNNPEIEVNALRPVAELTVAESGQLANVFAGILRSREFAWLQYQSGVLDGPTFDSYMETLIRWIRDYQAYQFWWETFSPNTNPEFTAYVNSMLEGQE